MLDPIDVRYFKLCCPDIGKESPLDINARCPVCGDSKTNKNTKRLHLYEKAGVTLVKCFNGGCPVNNNMYNFIKLYFPEHLHNYKREMFNKKLLEQPDLHTKNEQEQTTINNFNTIELEQYLDPINQDCLDYLKSRKIQYDESKYGKWYYGSKILNINDKKYNIIDKIVIPFYYNNKIYGFYSRSIKEKNFITFNLNEGYKIWNWFNINKEEPVYIFEGIFDAISSGKQNIIALCSLDLPRERLAELKNPIFCLDNDSTGIKKMLEYAKDYKVLIYDKDNPYKDFNSAKQNNYNIDFNIMTGFKAVVELKKLL